jgi:cytidylate kinase
MMTASIVRARMIVAIDGPAGAGKSTVARQLAEALGFTYLDTGAMYRCAGLRPDVDPAALDIRFDGERVLLGGEDVTAAIRTPEAGQAASRAATDPAVRTALTARQKALLSTGDWVAEGRDVGTVVAPHAELKVWLDADEAERARRREITVDDLRERDSRDAAREHAPMVAAEDAVRVDTTGKTIDEVVAEIAALARDRERGRA